MKYLPLIGLLLLSSVGWCQYNPLQAPNTYRSADNPNYWKNKLPFPGYWQQDVHYTIVAEVDEQTDIITGHETLTYWNNSPDDLTFVYFHLYQEAFQPESYLDALQRANHSAPRYGKYEKDQLGTKITSITANGKKVATQQENTLLKVVLPAPLKSGESITFDIGFNTYFGSGGTVRRRMKMYQAFGAKHYNGVHWYPRISVYDRKFGWTTDQHLGREFYGDFGTFDVELTFAANFIVDATGFLTNRQEVLPPALRQQLDLKNFANKPWNSAPSEIIPYDSTQHKTWKFHAENVHDFAFTADPNYRIGEAEWNGIKCIALALEPHAAGWQNAAEYTAKVIEVYSRDIGMYTYHKMIVADARDGMEYPMLTLDGGLDPSYRGLLAHEVGHNWFFGQVGNNETYRAALDEGFTQFLTAWALENIDGDTVVRNPSRSGYVRSFKKPRLVRPSNAYYGYLADAIKGEDPSLSTHSDRFNVGLKHGGGYRHVYVKTATMLYNLQYVLGDDLFLEAMQHYFSIWKIAHPYVEDFRTAIIQYTGVDLNWFFDQWLETSKRIDYAVKSVRKGKVENEYVITFQRKGSMQMPIDFMVTAKDGKQHHYHIPNTWFIKKTDATVLNKWIGWNTLHPTYEASVIIPSGIKSVVIDPSERLADINQLNNSSFLPLTVSFDSKIYNPPDYRKYEAFVRPDLWYNGYDGFKVGVHANGNYMRYKHQFDFNVWLNTGVAQYLRDPETATPYGNVDNDFDNISFRFNYKTSLDQFSDKTFLSLSAKWLDGLKAYTIGVDKKSRSGKTYASIYYKTLFRRDTANLNYLLFPNEWNLHARNNTLNLGLVHVYRYGIGNGDLRLNTRASSVGSEYDYAQVSLTAINRSKLGKLLLKTRAFAQYGTGHTPSESALFLAGANPEQLMNSKYTRSVGFVPYDWLGYGANVNHFHAGGGLNLRGYSGYLVPHASAKDSIRYTYKGNSGGALNLELDFHNMLRWQPGRWSRMFRVDPYLFADAGFINYNLPHEKLAFIYPRIDAGAGIAFTIKRWGPLETTAPFTIRFDAPMLLSRVPAAEAAESANAEYFKMRWVIGVRRAF